MLHAKSQITPPENLVYDPLTGIVTFLGERECDRTDPDVFILAAQSGDLSVIGMSRAPFRVTGSGAGLSFASAFWAAAGETVERYCAAIIPADELLFGSYAELRARNIPAVAPNHWALFHPTQFPELGIPQFTDDLRVAWVKGEHLSREADCHVPACLTFLSPDPSHYTAHESHLVGPATSTGLACARSALEATFKGVCEVIERDAFIIRWRNSLPCPLVEIDPASAIFSLYRDKFVRPGLEYAIFRTSLDLPYHSFFGVLQDKRHDPARILVGGACHPDANQAVLKTLIELAQGFQWANHVRTRKIELDAEFSAITSFESRMELYAFGNQRAAFDFLFEKPQIEKLSELESQDRGDLSRTLDDGISLLKKVGLEPIAVDMTSIDAKACGLSVVKVIIPECESLEGDHRMPFLGGQRWLEVPVRLGLRSEPMRLEERNKQPHPYP